MKERKNTVMSYDQRLVENAKCLLLYETLVTIFHTRGKKKKKNKGILYLIGVYLCRCLDL